MTASDDDAADAPLVARVLQPDRPRLADARAAMAHVRGLDEVWDVLATRDVIPMDWLDAPRRRFALPCGGCNGYGGYARSHYADTCKTCVGRGFTATGARPATMRASVTFASDPGGVATAEALARELLATLAFGAHAPTTVVWRHVTPERNFGGETFRFALRGLRAALHHASHPSGNAYATLERFGGDRYRRRPAAITAEQFDQALATVRTQAGADNRAMIDRLCDLWRTGYTFDHATTEHIVLLACEVG